MDTIPQGMMPWVGIVTCVKVFYFKPKLEGVGPLQVERLPINTKNSSKCIA